MRTRTFASDTEFFHVKQAAVDGQQGRSDLSTQRRLTCTMGLALGFQVMKINSAQEGTTALTCCML